MAERLSTTCLLRIKTPVQMSSSDQCHRIKARTRPCLRKSEEYCSLDLTSYSSLSPQPINDCDTSLWLSTQSLLDSSSANGRKYTKKSVSFSEEAQIYNYIKSLNEQEHEVRDHLSHRQLINSTPKRPSLPRAARSVPNLGSRKSSASSSASSSSSTESLSQKTIRCSRFPVEPHQCQDRRTTINSSCLSVQQLEGKEAINRTRCTTRSESRVKSIFSKKKSNHKKGIRSFSTLSRCFLGEDMDLEQSFEEFCRNKQLTRETGLVAPSIVTTKTYGEGAVKSENSAASKLVHASKKTVTNINSSEKTTHRSLHSSESKQMKSRSEIVLPLLKPMLSTRRSARPLKRSNSSDLDLYGRDDSHVQRLSFNDSCDSVEETRPLDQSMSEFIQTADIDNLASLVAFYDKVVNQSETRTTDV